MTHARTGTPGGDEEGAMQKNVLVVYGTRPEAIKLAPLVRALRADPDRRRSWPSPAAPRDARPGQRAVRHRARHRPRHDAATGRRSISAITAWSSTRLEPVMERSAPDAVVVQGDTSSAFAAASRAFYAGPGGARRGGPAHGGPALAVPGGDQPSAHLRARRPAPRADRRRAATTCSAEGIDPRGRPRHGQHRDRRPALRWSTRAVVFSDPRWPDSPSSASWCW